MGNKLTRRHNCDRTRKTELASLFVYVLNMRGQRLMPTKPRKAKKLLKKGKSKVISRTQFTMEKKEIYSTEVKLRTDIVKLNSERGAIFHILKNVVSAISAPM
jgi:hypothetical protein